MQHCTNALAFLDVVTIKMTIHFLFANDRADELIEVQCDNSKG